MERSGKRLVLVDLNNFARYPTLSVGLLTAILRASGYSVRVLCPLAVGVRGMRREPRARPWGVVDQAIRHATASSRREMVRRARLALSAARLRLGVRASRAVATRLAVLLPDADAVLVSTYSTHRDTCARLAAEAARRGLPLLVGGPAFTEPSVVEDWLRVPGLTGVVGGEVEDGIVPLAESLCRRLPLEGLPGVSVPGARPRPPRPPLRNLDALPFPDFDDFPWARYPSRIVPVLASRGCAWGACDFCSDVLTSAGRRFRPRPAERVLAELEHQSGRYATTSFVFTDLKLNSDLGLWRALLGGVQERVPGARWIGAVHVGREEENGLSREELKGARQAGMVRITTGLESGSQRVLDAMGKGTELERTSAFLRDAWEAGISVRTTMIVGHPAEEPDDVVASAAFLRRHRCYIDRVSLNRLQVPVGTPLERRLRSARAGGGDARPRRRPGSRRSRGSALLALLREVHAINRRPLPGTAREFDGVM